MILKKMRQVLIILVFSYIFINFNLLAKGKIFPQLNSDIFLYKVQLPNQLNGYYVINYFDKGNYNSFITKCYDLDSQFVFFADQKEGIINPNTKEFKSLTCILNSDTTKYQLFTKKEFKNKFKDSVYAKHIGNEKVIACFKPSLKSIETFRDEYSCIILETLLLNISFLKDTSYELFDPNFGIVLIRKDKNKIFKNNQVLFDLTISNSIINSLKSVRHKWSMTLVAKGKAKSKSVNLQSFFEDILPTTEPQEDFIKLTISSTKGEKEINGIKIIGNIKVIKNYNHKMINQFVREKFKTSLLSIFANKWSNNQNGYQMVFTNNDLPGIVINKGECFFNVNIKLELPVNLFDKGKTTKEFLKNFIIQKYNKISSIKNLNFQTKGQVLTLSFSALLKTSKDDAINLCLNKAFTTNNTQLKKYFHIHNNKLILTIPQKEISHFIDSKIEKLADIMEQNLIKDQYLNVDKKVEKNSITFAFVIPWKIFKEKEGASLSKLPLSFIKDVVTVKNNNINYFYIENTQ